MKLRTGLFHKDTLVWLVLALAEVANLSCGFAALVTRGPYLQQGTTNSVVLRWRTDLATDSFVRYGVSLDNMDGLTSDTALLTEHIVKLTGLLTDTRYYYQFGTSTEWFPASTNDYFFTLPPVGMARPTRIWALGDAGKASAEQAAVRDGYTLYNGTRLT